MPPPARLDSPLPPLAARRQRASRAEGLEQVEISPTVWARIRPAGGGRERTPNREPCRRGLRLAGQGCVDLARVRGHTRVDARRPASYIGPECTLRVPGEFGAGGTRRASACTRGFNALSPGTGALSVVPSAFTHFFEKCNFSRRITVPCVSGITHVSHDAARAGRRRRAPRARAGAAAGDAGRPRAGPPGTGAGDDCGGERKKGQKRSTLRGLGLYLARS